MSVESKTWSASDKARQFVKLEFRLTTPSETAIAN